MDVYIAHARMDENGKIDGPIPGDQTTKEIERRLWYENGSTYYIECLDEAMAARAAAFALQIAQNDAFGYSQKTRWTGYTSIKNNGFKIEGAGGNLDCASLIIVAYILAGLKIAATGYTGSLKGILEKTGKFKIYTDDEHTRKCKYAKVGSLYLRPRTDSQGGHVFIVLNNGSSVINTPITTPAAATETSIDKPYVQIKGTVVVRTGGTTAYPSIGTTKRDGKYPYKGRDTIGNKWYIIDFNGEEGHVTSNSKYTKLII